MSKHIIHFDHTNNTRTVEQDLKEQCRQCHPVRVWLVVNVINIDEFTNRTWKYAALQRKATMLGIKYLSTNFGWDEYACTS